MYYYANISRANISARGKRSMLGGGQLGRLHPTAPQPCSAPPHAISRTLPADPEISNRHTPRLESSATHSKHSSDLISNRHKSMVVFRPFAYDDPRSLPTAANTLRDFPASSVFHSRAVCPATRVLTPRKSPSVSTAKIPFQILEVNVNHGKQTTDNFLIATRFSIRNSDETSPASRPPTQLRVHPLFDATPPIPYNRLTQNDRGLPCTKP